MAPDHWSCAIGTKAGGRMDPRNCNMAVWELGCDANNEHFKLCTFYIDNFVLSNEANTIYKVALFDTLFFGLQNLKQFVHSPGNKTK